MLKYFDREKQWLDGLTTVDPDELPWKNSDQYSDREYQSRWKYWTMWNWSGLESIPISNIKKNIVCMTPYQNHDFPECSYDRYDIMNMIGEKNAEQYKNLTTFTEVFNGTKTYDYAVTESYPFMTRNINDTIPIQPFDIFNLFNHN